jgi:hypothetical protein
MTHVLKFVGTPPTFTAGQPFLSAHRSPSTTYPSPCLAAKWGPHVSHHILFFFLSVSSPRDVATMETGGGRELAPAPWPPLAVLVPRDACHASRNRHPPSISRPPNPSRSPIRLQAPSNLPVRRRFGEISPKSPTVAS